MSGITMGREPEARSSFNVSSFRLNKLTLSKEPNLVRDVETLSLEFRKGVNVLVWLFIPNDEECNRIIASFPHLRCIKVTDKPQRSLLTDA